MFAENVTAFAKMSKNIKDTKIPLEELIIFIGLGRSLLLLFQKCDIVHNYYNLVGKADQRGVNHQNADYTYIYIIFLFFIKEIWLVVYKVASMIP